MDKLAYEFGVKVAMVDCGLMEKQALSAGLNRALLGGGMGALGGTLAADEGHRLRGALTGGGMGALTGYSLGHTGVGLSRSLTNRGRALVAAGKRGRGTLAALGSLGALTAPALALPAVMGAAVTNDTDRLSR